MTKKDLTRRDFIKTTTVTGITSAIAISGLGKFALADTANPDAKPAEVKVPTRIYGKTKVPVSALCLGGIFDITANLIVLQKALDWGVTYWDTANGYVGGNSELGIGMYFEKFPQARKQVFLVTKTRGRDSAGMTDSLNTSFQRMKTNYIDMFFLHGISNPDLLTPEMKDWVEKNKASGKIKFFGFSTHSNMANCLMGASKLGWVDGIMLRYDFRNMQDDAMKAAVDACQKAGIGLTAMKTQGGGQVKTDSDLELKMAGRFLQKGFTPEQAKLKAVWENPAIGSICSQMGNITLLQANVAAAMDKTKLEAADWKALQHYAKATCSGHCAGCSDICESAMDKESRIADVMRYLMYHRSYGNAELARQSFAELPASVRRNIGKLDYSKAESVCPNKLAIGKLMLEAREILA